MVFSYYFRVDGRIVWRQWRICVHQMGEVAMRQGILAFEYRQDGSQTGGTALAGLLPYLELACVAGLGASIEDHVRVCSEKQGWTDAQMVLSLICLNLAGGDCVDDLRILERDPGFGRVWHQ